MRTDKLMVCLAASVLLLSGCKTQQATTTPPPAEISAEKSKGYQVAEKSPIEMLALESGTKEFRAYGEGESPNSQLALNIARAQAIAALQEKIQVNVKSGLDQYSDQTQVNTELSLDIKTRNMIQTAVKGIVNGAVVKDSRKLYNPENGMYKYEVCVAYDKASILNAIEQQNQRILKNRAQFEKDMQAAWDELDRENGNTPIREEQEDRRNAREQENLDRQNQRDVNLINASRPVAPPPAASAPSVNNYSYTMSVNGQNYGPYTYAQLQQMVPTRQITRESLVWREGMASWDKAGNLMELSGLFMATPPPLPAR